MTIRFYRGDGKDFRAAEQPVEGASIRIWRPAQDGLPPFGSRRIANLAWWLFARLGLFAHDGFAELTIWHGGRMLHRLIVTPRWYRFPFMAADDLQLGALWTHPDARGLGLARWGVSESLRRLGRNGAGFWYAVDASNEASVRLIESCRFRLVGTGERTKPLGIRWLGRFRLETSTG